ncbi:MAG: purine-nucleoside phosphorylase [Gemmataceae bacterium]|nr:purine-nucleoside phosphorylase [Gemmataceae bacterium]
MRESADYAALRAALDERKPRLALILGSGLGELDRRLHDAIALPYAQVPGLIDVGVVGHKGRLIVGRWGAACVVAFSGRTHYYEGHGWHQTAAPVVLAWSLGVSDLLVTNAAGGIRDDLVPGSLMLVADHLECTRPYWWREPGPGGLGGPRPSPYDPGWRHCFRAAAAAGGMALAEGVYAQVTGPCYETKAEVRALRRLGADAVGMSTAHEVRTAHELGLRCAAISCITNRAAGLAGGPIHHDEVLDAAANLRARLGQLLDAAIGLWLSCSQTG